MIWRYEWSKWMEKVLLWFVWKLPRPVVYWSAIRLAVHNLEGHPDERPISESLKAWKP